MSKEIITRYTGLFRQSTFQLNGDGENLQIAVLDPVTRKEKIIFTGDKFSEEEYKENGWKDEERYKKDLGIVIVQE
jgi:hypothetical protein